VAVADDAYSVADAVDLRRTDGGTIEAVRPHDPPEWATDAAIYEVYVRTFPGQGSDQPPFEAIGEQLDYIADLGIDVLWLTPVLANDHAPHGYNITDFFSIASDLGAREDYERLVSAAHDRGMRVLFDLVFNHSAREHPNFRDAYRTPGSPYREWYEWQESGEPGTYFDWEYIANFDFDSLAVRRHLLDVVDEWAPLVDGFRCDMAWAVPNPFWTEVHDRVKRLDAEFFLLDETIPYIPDFQAGLFDVHFDSTTAFTLREIGAGDAPAASVLDAVAERRRIGFPDHAAFMLYVENHDETRYVRTCGKPAARAAAGALATLPGAPLVYAGQEFGQLGKRDDLDWANADPDLRAHYRRLLALRDAHPALSHDAALDRIGHDVRAGDPESVVAYRRVNPDAPADTAGERAVVVALNFAEDPAEVDLAPAVAGTDLVRDGPIGTDPVPVEDVVVLPADVRVIDG
jgi:glycosidase